ncbi:MAG: rhamnulokinase [Propionibacteriaceae bacterium]|jgi:rhamnulokinase|nr:rhamnulokinase [Propionibacteriaceae bacterium]
MNDGLFAAADLGATSGRVIAGQLVDGRFALTEVHRFTTPVMETGGHLHWDADALRGHIAQGLTAAGTTGSLAGVGVDTWGVDYARLDASGQLLEPPYNYRDHRTNGGPAAFFAGFPAARLYAEAGLQVMEFNTVFQYVSQATDPRWDQVACCLFLPDLFTFWLSGTRVAELTIASTSGLLDVARRTWSPTLLGHIRERYGLDLAPRLPAIVEPGTVVGSLDPAILPGDIPVVAVGSHDTASAIVSVPATTRHFAYISSGTWSLVGLELDRPVLTEGSRAADFTNELGLDGTVRYLRNVMGLWVLTESQREWARQGLATDLAALLAAAAALPALTTVVNMEDPRLLPPGDMPSRLAALARETGQLPPGTPAEVTRCILDSLALDYRRVIRQAQTLADAAVEVVHIVGGGCRNQLLNQLTAEATGLPVVAGPAEGTALGNLLVQARAVGALDGDLLELRRVSRASCELTTYTPGGLPLPETRWSAAEQRAYGR